MSKQPIYLSQIAVTLCAALRSFRNDYGDCLYQTGTQFSNGHVSVNVQRRYQDENAIFDAACTVTITLDQVVPGIADLIANGMFRYVWTVASYHIQEHPDDPRIVKIYLVERLHSCYLYEEDFLVVLAKIIDRNRSRLVRT